MKYTELLNEYKSGVELVENKIKGLSKEALNYRPVRKDGWTIKEHIIHMVDSETNGFIRIKSIIAQPGSETYVMDEDRWTANIRRKNEDMNKYLELFGSIRSIVYDLLADEPEENWIRDFFIRDYSGEQKKITILQAVQLYVNHAKGHMEYIDTNLEEFRGKITPGNASA
jgi:hypothetical protein